MLPRFAPAKIGRKDCRKNSSVFPSRSKFDALADRISAIESLRIVYLAGPGDAPSVLRAMAAGNPFKGIAHVAYSGQLFEVCRALGADLLSISTSSRIDDFSFDRLRAINVEDPLTRRGGLFYHYANVRFARLVRRYVREFRANVLINGPEPYPFLIEDLADHGVKIVPALHATLLPEFKKSSVARRLAVNLSRRFFSRTCSAILSHPGGTVGQVLKLTENNPRPIVEFLPLLRADAFPGIQDPRLDAKVFRVMTVGRVEPEKGIFSLIEAARLCKERLGGNVRFDVCGAGTALEEARSRVAAMGLHETMTLHGWTTMDDMARLWGESHVAVVPTTSDFTEGFNQVVIEAVLAGRPVITSRVCPALAYVRPCAIEVEVDDVEAYARAIVDLATNKERYGKMQQATRQAIVPFLDPSKSFGAAVELVLRAILSGREATPVSHPPAF